MSRKKNKKPTGGTTMEKDKEEIREEVVAETMEDEASAPAGDEKKEEPATDKAAEACDRLEAENRELREEVASLKDKLIRNAADTENYKKRLQRDKEDAVRYANTALVKDLIGPLDDFSRALDAAEQSSNFDALKEGVRMIEDRLYTILKTNWGLEVIDENNVPFNPDEHEACLMEEVDGLDEDTVTMMLQKGYKLNGRVIRPAKVKVGKPKS